MRSHPRRWRGAGTARRRLSAADLDGSLAQQAVHDLAAVVILDQHVLLTLRIGATNGENHRAQG